LQNARVVANRPFNTAQGQCTDGTGSQEPRHYCWAGRADWPADNQSPLGRFNVIRAYTAFGWAFDPDDLPRAVLIHFHIDRVFAGAATANQPRPAINDRFWIPGDRGWSWAIPPVFRAPGLHSVTAYALDYTVVTNLGTLTYAVP
jgi:hypothetical protein